MREDGSLLYPLFWSCCSASDREVVLSVQPLTRRRATFASSTAASPTPNNAAWPAVTLSDNAASQAFPVVTLSYIIVPISINTV